MNVSDNVTDVVTVSTTSDAPSRYLQYGIIQKNIILYTSPVLLVCGLVGNSLILAVLRRRELGHMPPAPYLAALAVTDIAFLASGLTDLWLYYGFNIIIGSIDILAKLKLYIIFSTLFSSSWLVMTVTVDRFVSVCFPFHALKIRRRHRISVAVAIIIFSMCVNVHFLIFARRQSIQNDYTIFLHQIWGIVHLVVGSLIPFIVIAVCNVGIIVASNRSKRQRAELQCGHQYQRNPNSEQERQADAHITVLLVTLNIFFIVTTGPVAMCIIYTGYISVPTDDEERARQTLILACLNLLAYVNNTFNFALYCITGKRFRVALTALFGCRKLVGNTNATHTGLSNIRNSNRLPSS